MMRSGNSSRRGRNRIEDHGRAGSNHPVRSVAGAADYSADRSGEGVSDPPRSFITGSDYQTVEVTMFFLFASLVLAKVIVSAATIRRMEALKLLREVRHAEMY